MKRLVAAAALLTAGIASAQTDLIDGGTWGLQRPSAQAADMGTENVPDSPAGFHTALRINVNTPNPLMPWSIQLSQSINAALADKQALRFRLWGRSETNTPIELVFEKNGPPYTQALTYLVRLTPDWTEYAMPFTTSAYAAGGAALRIRLGYAAGTVELGAIQLENFGVNPQPFPAPIHFDAFGGQAHDDSWREDANARIRRYRMGDVQVQVRDANGNPVSGASVSIAQTRHAFRFGTAIADRPLFASNSDGDPYRANFVKLFNYAVLENQLKWDWSGGLDAADRMLSWCADHDLPVRGHNLFWPNYEHVPPSVRNLRGQDMRDAVQSHITDYATRMQGRVVVWDVINEGVSNHQVTDEAGRDLLWLSYAWAHAADPYVDLAYNDYDILNNRAGASDGHRAAVAALIRELQANNAPLNVLGVQSHMSYPWTPAPKLLSILDEWAQFGLPVEITEYDATLPVIDEDAQGRYMDEFLTAVFSHPNVRSFVMWGFWDGAHWLGQRGAGLFRRDWSPRPAEQTYERLVFHDWWTNDSGSTGADGSYATRAFLGHYAVTASKDGKTASVETDVLDRDAANPVTVQLP